MKDTVWQDVRIYALGYGLAILLTGISFAIVFFHLLVPHTAFILILVLALIQVVVHLRCFLHISFRKSAREDLHLILFSAIVIVLMVGGTFIVLFNLDSRMM